MDNCFLSAATQSTEWKNVEEKTHFSGGRTISRVSAANHASVLWKPTARITSADCTSHIRSGCFWTSCALVLSSSIYSYHGVFVCHTHVSHSSTQWPSFTKVCKHESLHSILWQLAQSSLLNLTVPSVLASPGPSGVSAGFNGPSKSFLVISCKLRESLWMFLDLSCSTYSRGCLHIEQLCVLFEMDYTTAEPVFLEKPFQLIEQHTQNPFDVIWSSSSSEVLL